MGRPGNDKEAKEAENAFFCHCRARQKTTKHKEKEDGKKTEHFKFNSNLMLL